MRSYAAGGYVWNAGEAARHFTLIESGVVKIRRITPSGEAVVLGLFGPHENIGVHAALERREYPADARALTETVEVLRVAAEPVLDLLST